MLLRLVLLSPLTSLLPKMNMSKSIIDGQAGRHPISVIRLPAFRSQNTSFRRLQMQIQTFPHSPCCSKFSRWYTYVVGRQSSREKNQKSNYSPFQRQMLLTCACCIIGFCSFHEITMEGLGPSSCGVDLRRLTMKPEINTEVSRS